MPRYLGSIPVPVTASKNGDAAPFEAGEEQGGGPSVVRPWDEPIRTRVGVTPLDVRFPPNKVCEFLVRVCFGVSSEVHLVLRFSSPVIHRGGSREHLKPNRRTSQSPTPCWGKKIVRH